MFPFLDANGKPTGFARLKPDRPRQEGGKYENPKGKPFRLYIPQGCSLKAQAKARREELLDVLREETVPWDQAAAEKLLADLQAEIRRAETVEFGGKPPRLFRTLAADLVAIGEGYIQDHDREAARGWDAMAMLRDLKPLLVQVAARVAVGAR